MSTNSVAGYAPKIAVANPAYKSAVAVTTEAVSKITKYLINRAAKTSSRSNYYQDRDTYECLEDHLPTSVKLGKIGWKITVGVAIGAGLCGIAYFCFPGATEQIRNEIKADNDKIVAEEKSSEKPYIYVNVFRRK